MDKNYYIYKITNLVNGKIYIGETQAISQMLDGKRKTAAGLHWVRLDKRRTRRKK